MISYTEEDKSGRKVTNSKIIRTSAVGIRISFPVRTISVVDKL